MKKPPENTSSVSIATRNAKNLNSYRTKIKKTANNGFFAFYTLLFVTYGLTSSVHFRYRFCIIIGRRRKQ